MVATNPEWLSLPGTGIISNFALFIASYIPVSLLTGNAFGVILERWSKRLYISMLMVILITVVSLVAVPQRMKDVQIARHALVTRPDLHAMAWIRENTPIDAQFLVNSFFAYGGSSVVGSDGGWWIPLLTKRGNTVPPLNYSAEQGPFTNYRE